METNIIAKNFLETIWKPGAVHEVRCFDARGFTTSGYFDAPAKAYGAILPVVPTHEIYMVLNPCKPELIARANNRFKSGRNLKTTGNDDITELRLLLVDVDPVRVTGVSATETEKGKAYPVACQIIRKHGNPLLFGDSGNGFHLIYPHDSDKPEALREFLLNLGKNFNTEHVKIDLTHNPARISRVMGTFSRKGDSTHDRPHRQSNVINFFPDTEKLHIPPLQPPQITSLPPQNQSNNFDSIGYVRELLQHNNIEVVKEKNHNGNYHFCLMHCFFNHEHKNNDASVMIMGGTNKICYQCHHHSCKGNQWEHVKPKLNIPEKKYYCKFCNQEIIWIENKPHNLNQTRHFCQNSTSKTPASTTTPEKVSETVQVNELQAPERKKDVLLPIEKIHPIYADYWRQFAGHAESCPEYVLTSFLVSQAAVLGNKTVLKTDRGIHPNMYALLLGDSTLHRKTTGMDYGTEPLKLISGKKTDKYFEELNEWHDKVDEWKDLSKQEKIGKENPEKNKPIDYSWIYADEITPEELLQKMVYRPDGLFLYSEVATLLSRLDSGYMKGFKEKLTDFFDGRSIKFRREIKSGRPTIIDTPCPSLLACSTFQWLQKSLQDADLMSGFLGRFVIVCRRSYPEKLVAWPPHFLPNPKFMKILLEFDKFTFDITPTKQAKDSYQAWYENFMGWLREQDKFLHSFLGRLLTVCHKVAIINHVNKYVIQGVEKPDKIDIDSYEFAYPWIEFWKENIVSCYDELTLEQNETNLQELRILEIIRKKGKNNDNGHIKITQRDLSRAAKMKISVLREVTETLIEKAYIQKLTSKSGKQNYYVMKKEEIN